MRFILLIILWAVFSVTGSLGAPWDIQEDKPVFSYHNYEANINGITFTIDPRVELFNIVAMQFGHSGMTLSNIPYKKQSLDYFAPYADLPAPKLLLDTWKKGWGVDDPIFFLLYLDENFIIQKELPEGIIERGGGMEQLQKLAASFREYAEQSNFEYYFNTLQKDFYRQVLAQTAYNFKNFEAIDEMENYYGEEADSYTLILNLMSGYGNFGRAIRHNGRLDLYALVETRVSAGELPLYIPSVDTRNLILHEFSHGFVNPSVDEYQTPIAEFDSLLNPIRESMKYQAYQSWHTVVIEHIVRANVIRLARDIWGESLARNVFYREEIGRRFIYIDALDEKLADYEAQRGQYPRFSQFVPELLKAFSELREGYISEKQQKVEELRKPRISTIPKKFSYAKDSTTVFVVGTREKDSMAQQAMHEWVKTYRNMMGNGIQIISDTAATERDLSNNDIVVFGTPEGNRFLQKHISQIPVSVTEQAIITNRKTEGDDLQLVVSWVNPYNPEKAMVIYTAQQVSDIRNFQQSPVREEYHYWVAQNLITLHKGDFVSKGQIWMPNPKE